MKSKKIISFLLVAIAFFVINNLNVNAEAYTCSGPILYRGTCNCNGVDETVTGSTNYSCQYYCASQGSDPTGGTGNLTAYCEAGSISNGKCTFQSNLDTCNGFSNYTATLNRYSLTYDSNGGTGCGSREYNFGTIVDLSCSPTRDGYTFTGWFDVAEGGTELTSILINGDKTVYAHWERNKCKLSYHTDGGTSCADLDANCGDTVTPNCASTKTGYELEGWYSALGGGSKVTSIKLDSNKTVYAHWTEKKCTLIYDTVGGVNCDKTVVNCSENINYPVCSTTKTGYKFDDWYTASTGGSKVSFPININSATNNSSSMTIYAHWIEAGDNVFAVTFNAMGGSVSPSSKTVTKGSTYGSLPVPIKGTAHFDGWYTAATGGSAVVSTTVVNLTSNQTLYAHWTNAGDNECWCGTSGNPNTYHSEPCNNSSCQSVCTSFGQTVIATSCTVDVTYTVTFDANGGSVSPTSKTVVAGTQYGGLPTPTKANAHFDGWYTAKTGGSAVKSTTVANITSNQTLYAHWTTAAANTCICGTSGSESTYHTIQCDNSKCENLCRNNYNQAVIISSCSADLGNDPGDPGDPGDSGNVSVISVTISPKPVEVEVGKNVYLTATVSPDNATNKKVNWSSSDPTIATVDNNGKVTGVKVGTVTVTATTVDGGKTDTVQVTVKAAGSGTITHNIYFDCTTNGGTGTMTPISVNYGSTVTLPETSCTKAGYSFKNWIGYDDEGTAIENGTYQDKSSIDYTFSTDITLKADYSGSSDTYLIRYDANGGKGTMNPTEAKSGVSGTLAANTFKYAGNTFAGWKAYYKDSNNNLKALTNKDIDYKNKATFVDLFGPNGEEVTLYAQWKVKNPNTGIVAPTAIIGGLLLISAFGYYLVKKKNIVLE